MSENTHPHTISALAKRRAELIADNQAMRERIRLNDGYIKALDTAIGLMDPGFDPGTVLPKRKYTKKFDRGELKSMVIQTLKAADGGPLSTRDITDQVMERKGMTEDCRTEVRRALLSYDVVEKVEGGPDDHMEYWSLVGYAAKRKNGGVAEKGNPELKMINKQQ